MKHVFSTVLSTTIAAVSGQVFAQSMFFCDNVTSGVNAPVTDQTGELLDGPEWRAELYGSVVSDSLRPLVDYENGTRSQALFIQPGHFHSGNGDLVVLEAAPGGWAWLQVKVWSVGLGATYEDAVARGLGGYGESPLFYAEGNNPGVFLNPPAPLIGLQSFSVTAVVPEPSPGALLLLGGLGLCWAARRRVAPVSLGKAA